MVVFSQKKKRCTKIRPTKFIEHHLNDFLACLDRAPLKIHSYYFYNFSG